MTAYILCLVLCFCLSAFFSASEMSLSAANRVRLENAAEDDPSGGRLQLNFGSVTGGDVTLYGTPTYTGDTHVSGGTLNVGAAANPLPRAFGERPFFIRA